MIATGFQIGDVVRVRSARRRDIRFRVIELGPVIVAVNDRGGEARHSPDAFELVRPPSDTASASCAPPPPTWTRIDDTAAAASESAVCDGVTVRPYPGEHIDSLWRRFRRAIDKSNVLREFRQHRHFVSKSQRRRDKSARARIRGASFNSTRPQRTKGNQCHKLPYQTLVASER